MEPQQPPQGQPYPAQGYPQGHQPPPGHPQQGYQMGPPPWQPPPPKKGIPGWAIALIVVGVFVFVVIPILALAAIPLITTNTRDARRGEGKAMMQTAMGHARVFYNQHSEPPQTVTETGLTSDHLIGNYYRVNDTVRGNHDHGEVTCVPIEYSEDGRGRLTFGWYSGSGEVDWE